MIKTTINKPKTLFRNRLQKKSDLHYTRLIPLAVTTGMNISVENNMLHLLYQTN